MPTLEEVLHKEFDLNDLQRQSAEWASKCSAIDFGLIFRSVDKAMEERRIRKIRDQIAQELAFIEAARAAPAVVK